MATMRLDIAYDGTGFSGWAAQPGLRTVQGELESALGTVLREEVALTVAGRTDAGVHAWGQVASFHASVAPAAGLARQLNGVGPPDIAVTGAALAEDAFDARRDARSRTYCYRLLAREAPSPFERGRALWHPQRLDIDKLEHSARAIAGEHDFTAFTPTDSDHVRFERRVLRSEWRREQGHEDIWCFWIEADAFMRNMVRVLVGTMLEIARGNRDLAQLRRLLEGAPRGEAGETAPAHGLYLASVSY